MFRILTFLLGITNSIRARLLQPSLPAISASLMSSSPLVSTRSSNYSFLVVLSNIWTKKLSPAHCRSPMDCLQLAVLLSQEMSGWFSCLSQPSGGLFWEAVSFLAGFQPQPGNYDGQTPFLLPKIGCFLLTPQENGVTPPLSPSSLANIQTDATHAVCHSLGVLFTPLMVVK